MIHRFILSLIFLISTSLVSQTSEYLRGDFLSVEKAKKKWGNQKFDPIKFKSSGFKEKAAMAADATQRQVWVGKDPVLLRAEMGEPDGYFFSDTILAYQIEPYSDSHKEAWQLVFIPDKQNKLIDQVKIHKKCCYPETK